MIGMKRKSSDTDNPGVKKEPKKAEHGFPAFIPDCAEILILGSFPSVKSREREFFYAHPQNRFWKTLAYSFGEDEPKDTEEKKSFLERRGIALYDVIESCEISGSSDSSIKNVLPADIKNICKKARIEKIILNGKTAGKYFEKYFSDIDIPHVTLPSTSPANAAWSLEELIKEWRKELF